jgi:predicted DNA-binding transcriptional regulator YafY
MSKRQFLSRYNIIINKLKKRPATFKEIDACLARESEIRGEQLTVSKKTFSRDLDEICALCNIDIRYDFSKRVYSISGDNGSVPNGRLMEAFDTFNALNLSGGLASYIHFEDRKPTGSDNLYGLLHAIKNRLLVNFSYQKYWDTEPNQRKAEPYLLKEFKNRWYLLAKDLGDGQIKTFAFDRLTELDITRKTFTQVPETEDRYKYCFSIMAPNAPKPSLVELAFEPHQGKYIKSMPLHHSQIVTVDTEDELRVELYVYLTQDFVMELLSYGENVTVIQPEALKIEMKEILTTALKNYN